MDVKHTISELKGIVESASANQSDPKSSLEKIDAIQTSLKLNMARLTAHDLENLNTEITKARAAVNPRKKIKFKFGQQKLVSIPKLPIKDTNSEDLASPSTTTYTEQTLLFSNELLPKQELKNYKSSVIRSQVSSSFFGSDLRGSTLILNCQQCRLRSCANLVVYIYGCNPIIENCKDIQFFSNSKLSVSDFQWLNPVLPSPNYRCGVVDKKFEDFSYEVANELLSKYK